MKLLFISAIISLLTMAECNTCWPSYFSTSSGCKKCFCSGVTDQCYARTFPTGKITGGLGQISGSLYDDASDEWSSVALQYDGTEVQHRFNKNRDGTFTWQLPSKYLGNRARSYGGKLNLTHKITPIFVGQIINEDLRVYLVSGEFRLSIDVEPIASSGDYLLYSIPLFESSWYVLTGDYPLATRNDIMRVLISLDEILIEEHGDFEKKAIFIKDISMDVAAEDAPSDSPPTDSIEICKCPEGYRGESCELCSPDYIRNVDNKIESVFGACELKPKLPASNESKFKKKNQLRQYLRQNEIAQNCL